ncbi:hypothetical protein CC2G_012335 [Coprinopsis cinerea AmutBmut pab1-1]|nr:hypothetical protein CC2G_012335 [Coprinopsis cinerea AmutBmut pab1-1]
MLLEFLSDVNDRSSFFLLTIRTAPGLTYAMPYYQDLGELSLNLGDLIACLERADGEGGRTFQCARCTLGGKSVGSFDYKIQHTGHTFVFYSWSIRKWGPLNDALVASTDLKRGGILGARRAERTCDSGPYVTINVVASEGILDVDGPIWRATSADLERYRESDVSLAFRVADLLSQGYSP